MKKASRTSQFVTILPLARKGYHHVNLTIGNESFQISIGGHKKREAEWIRGRVIKMLDQVVADELKAREAGKEFWEGAMSELKRQKHG